MKVRCISKSVSAEQARAIGMPERYNPEWALTVRREYLVLGIRFLLHLPHFGSAPVLEIQEDNRHYCVSIPSCLFEIVDPRPSRFWVVKKQGDFDLALWPEEFYARFFHDDLTEGVKAVREVYQAVVKKLEQEFPD